VLGLICARREGRKENIGGGRSDSTLTTHLGKKKKKKEQHATRLRGDHRGNRTEGKGGISPSLIASREEEAATTCLSTSSHGLKRESAHGKKRTMRVNGVFS